MIEVNLEQIARKIGLREKHADKLVLTNSTAIVIEETGRAEIRDVEKLENTIELIRHGPLGHYLKQAKLINTPPTKLKFVAVLHTQHRHHGKQVPHKQVTQRHRLYTSKLQPTTAEDTTQIQRHKQQVAPPRSDEGLRRHSLVQKT